LKAEQFLKLQMANKYMNKCSTSSAIKEIQIKTLLRFHLTVVRMAIIIEKLMEKIWGNKEPM
jgi:hypothetical protein